MFPLILLAVGLLASTICAGYAAQCIKDSDYISLTCVFVGVAAAGLIGLIDPLYGAIAGVAVGGVSFLLSLSPFEKGQLKIYQPRLFRRDLALDPSDWLIVSPGLRIFWSAICEHIATVQVGKVVISEDEAKTDVMFRGGKGTIKFRLDAELPIDLPDTRAGRFAMLEQFVKATPSGTSFTNSEERSKNVRAVCLALTRKMLEAAAEKVSAFDADAAEIENFVRAPKTAGGDDSPLNTLLLEIEKRVGLPAELIQFTIEDVELGQALLDNVAARATNDAIREKATELLNASSVPPPILYRAMLREEQASDAARFEAMSPAELADVSKMPQIIKLRKAKEAMMGTAAFETMVTADNKTPALKKAESINDYKRRHGEAEAALEIAEREEALYRSESVAREKENKNAEAPLLVLAPPETLKPEKIKLAERLLRKLEEYKSLYGQVLQAAVDKTAAGADTSRVSISGLEGIGGAHGLEALRVLGGVKK